MTVMTLMTLISRRFLDGGGGHILHRRCISWTFQLSHSSGACPTGYWDDNLCHHFWQEGGLSLWWGHERVFSRVYGVGSRGHRCILVTAVTLMTRTTARV
jgi:hypothetical protein